MICLLYILAAYAQVHADDANDKKSFDDLCAYDQMCNQARNQDGTFITPRPNLVNLLTELREPIRVYAHEMGVDPRAVAGAILAENSLNVTVSTSLHAFYEKMKLVPGGNYLSKIARGKSLSLGLGQIKPETAFEAEKILAKREKRAAYSFDEVSHRLQNPLDSIKYAAAIVKGCQDAYQEAGIDVRDNPGILTSLYNLGGCSNRARKAVENKQAPRPNFFGFFVKRYTKDLEQIVDAKRPFADQETSDLQKKIDGQADVANKAVAQEFAKPQTLYPFPPQCNAEGAGNASEYNHDKTLQMPQAVAEGTGEFEVVAQGIDCDAADWSLVKTKQGKIGWVPNDQLNQNAQTHAPPGFFTRLVSRESSGESCDPKAAAACKQEVDKALKGKTIAGDKPGAAIEMKLIGGADAPDKPNTKKFFGSMCLHQNTYGNTNKMGVVPAQQAGMVNAGYGYGNPAFGGNTAPVLKSEDATKLIAALNNKQKDIIATMGYKDWQDPENIFRERFKDLTTQLSDCQKHPCNGTPDSLNAFLKSDVNLYKGYRGLNQFEMALSQVFFTRASEVNLPGRTERQKWQAYFKETETICAPTFKAMPETATIWKEFRKNSKVDDTEVDPPPYTEGMYGDTRSTCRTMTKAVARNAPPSEAKTEAADCHCDEAEVPSYMNNGYMKAYNDALLAVLKKPDDFNNFLKDSLGRMAMLFNRPTMPQPVQAESMCQYDPIESAKRAETLLKMKCVEAVFVPDMFLVNKLRQYKDRVFYKPFDQDDRFSFSIKKSCEGKVTQ